MRHREYRTARRDPSLESHSENPTVVEYAVREMFKRKSPSTAAKNTASRLNGATNMFVDSKRPVNIDPEKLEQTLYLRMVDFTINNMGKMHEDKQHYALDGTIDHFRQGPAVRRKIKQLIIRQLGHDPFMNDNRP